MEQEIASAPEAEDVSPSKQVRPPASSSLANKIAAFASGVAPVKQGITNASEDAITVEDVLHKLESASRVSQRAVARNSLASPAVFADRAV